MTWVSFSFLMHDIYFLLAIYLAFLSAVYVIHHIDTSLSQNKLFSFIQHISPRHQAHDIVNTKNVSNSTVDTSGMSRRGAFTAISKMARARTLSPKIVSSSEYFIQVLALEGSNSTYFPYKMRQRSNSRDYKGILRQKKR